MGDVHHRLIALIGEQIVYARETIIVTNIRAMSGSGIVLVIRSDSDRRMTGAAIALPWKDAVISSPSMEYAMPFLCTDRRRAFGAGTSVER